MWPSIVISCVSILGMIGLLIFYPEIKIKGHHFQTFYLAPLLGALIILAFHLVDYPSLGAELVKSGSINPLEILALFLSMSFLSVVLEESNFFAWLASWVANRYKKSQMTLFLSFYLLTSLLTIVTSNDIIILTFTPFLLFFCRRAKVNPLPYLVSEFVSANTWSMLLVIGNPTNIYLAGSFNITFNAYFLNMLLPTILAGLASLGVLLLIFHKPLKEPLMAEGQIEPLSNKFLAVVSLSILAITTLMMALSNFINISMWIVALSGAGLLLVVVLIYELIKKSPNHYILGATKRLPLTVVPFILSMFVIVECLNEAGVLSSLANYFSTISPYLGVGLFSFLGANVLNNIPMSVLFSSILSWMKVDSLLPYLYLTIISSNIGAYLTPIGALAGFMWVSILKNHHEKFSYLDFLKYMSPISIISLAFAFLGLYFTSLIGFVA